MTVPGEPPMRIFERKHVSPPPATLYRAAAQESQEKQEAAAESLRPASIVRLSLLSACLLAAAGVAASTMLFASLLLPLVQIITGRPVHVNDASPLAFIVVFFRDMTPIEQFRALALATLGVVLLRSIFSYADNRASSFMSL